MLASKEEYVDSAKHRFEFTFLHDIISPNNEQATKWAGLCLISLAQPLQTFLYKMLSEFQFSGESGRENGLLRWLWLLSSLILQALSGVPDAYAVRVWWNKAVTASKCCVWVKFSKLRKAFGHYFLLCTMGGTLDYESCSSKKQQNRDHAQHSGGF